MNSFGPGSCGSAGKAWYQDHGFDSVDAKTLTIKCNKASSACMCGKAMEKNPNKQVSHETHPLPDREGSLLALEEKANTPLSVSNPATNATHTFSHFPT